MSINRPTIQEIECFLAVADELSFSRAARRLHLSQPPLSRHIRSLEEKLGATLFARSTRSVTLTDAGSLYLSDARDLMMKLDSAGAAVRRSLAGEVVRLRLAFVGALVDARLVDVLRRFRRLHPDCQIHLSDLAPGAQLEALREGRIDAGFIGAAPLKSGRYLQTFIWQQEPLEIALPESHPLAPQPTVRPAQLNNEGWVMVSREAAPAFRAQFDRFCTKTRLKPRIVQESERVAAVLTMVAAEQGISLLPAALSRTIGHGVVFRPLHAFKMTLEHTFAHVKEVSPPLRDFIKLLKSAKTGEL
jgi:DNA-binding transcriptional LysR family regulator